MTTQYIKQNTQLPEYDPFPKYLWNMTDLTDTEKLIYAALLGRVTLSQKNNWTDEDGNIYIIFEIKNIMKYVGRSKSTVHEALKNLEVHDLIVRKKAGYNRANHIYVKIITGSTDCIFKSEIKDHKSPITWNGKVQKSGKSRSDSLDTNNNNINNKKLNNNNSTNYSEKYNYTKGEGF